MPGRSFDRRPAAALAGLCLMATLALAAGGCTDDPLAGVAGRSAEADVPVSASTSPQVMQKIAELREWSAPFHDLEKAAEAGYTVNIGCIDETIGGVDPSVARGMGYHVTRGDMDLIGDGVVDIDQPEFLVYAPHERDTDLPKEERLAAARLVSFDYFVPGALWTDPNPPEFFGDPFNWSEVFQGWMRHINLWGHNPEGMFEDFNADVRLCTELLSP